MQNFFFSLDGLSLLLRLIEMKTIIFSWVEVAGLDTDCKYEKLDQFPTIQSHTDKLFFLDKIGEKNFGFAKIILNHCKDYHQTFKYYIQTKELCSSGPDLCQIQNSKIM